MPKTQRKTVQYTVRGVSRSVDRALRKCAKERKISLRQLLLAVVTQAAEADVEPAAHHDLDQFIGMWIEDPQVDEALKEQRKMLNV